MKTIYKKWWFWTFIILLLGAAGLAITSIQQPEKANPVTSNSKMDASLSNVPNPEKQSPSDTQQSVVPDKKDSTTAVNKSAFEQLEHGMTYREVEKILGVSGKIISQSGSPDEPLYTVVYQFPISSTDHTVIQVTFQSGRLLKKEQVRIN